MSADQPRLLANRSELGYTPRTAEALPHEPEAVPADYQHHLAGRASRSGSRRRQDNYGQRRRLLEGELDGLIREGLIQPGDTRLLRRELERVERRLATAY